MVAAAEVEGMVGVVIADASLAVALPVAVEAVADSAASEDSVWEKDTPKPTSSLSTKPKSVETILAEWN